MTEMMYAVALGEARSCLAALADSSNDMDLSILYDHLLIELDSSPAMLARRTRRWHALAPNSSVTSKVRSTVSASTA